MLPTDVPVVYTHVPRDTNYVCNDDRFCVINHGGGSDYGDNLIDECQRLVVRMFEEGDLANSFSYKEKKRANTSSSAAMEDALSSTKNPSSSASISTTSSITSISNRMHNKKKRKQKKLKKI